MKVRQQSLAMSCQNTFKSVALGLQNYSDTYAQLPPPVIYKTDGSVKHSWRSRITNFMVAMRPYYNDNDSWDGLENRRLINGHVFHIDASEDVKGGSHHGPVDLAIFYRCPSHDANIQYATNILAIRGEETLWPRIGYKNLSEIPDGAENTILIAEVTSMDVYWSEPKDFDFNTMSFAINDPNRPSISSLHPEGPCVAMADGSVYRIAKETPPEIVRALLTADGGEPYAAKKLKELNYLK